MNQERYNFHRICGSPAVGRSPVHRRHGHQHEHAPAAQFYDRGDHHQRVVGGGAAVQVQDVAEAEEPEHALQTTVTFPAAFISKQEISLSVC